MKNQVYHDAASTVIAAGQFPFPVNDTMISLIEMILTEDQAEFVTLFNKPLNIEQLKEQTGLGDKALHEKINSLMADGVIIGVPGRTTGQIIYRVLPPFPGIFEYAMIRGETGEKQKKLAHLFEKLFEDMAERTQKNHKALSQKIESMPPALTRVIPVQKEIDPKFDTVMPYEDVKKVIDYFDTIAVAYCYCRHQKDLIGKPCKITDQRKNCLFFGRTADYIIKYNFGEKITKDRAKAIVKEAEKTGLVHKAFHEKADIEREEMAICSCCKCCCEMFQIYYRGAGPFLTNSSYIAAVNKENCTGCGECANLCPMEAVEITEEIAQINQSRCIGCGVCAYNCSDEAVTLQRTGKRAVFVLPPKHEDP